MIDIIDHSQIWTWKSWRSFVNTIKEKFTKTTFTKKVFWVCSSLLWSYMVVKYSSYFYIEYISAAIFTDLYDSFFNLRMSDASWYQFLITPIIGILVGGAGLLLYRFFSLIFVIIGSFKLFQLFNN